MTIATLKQPKQTNELADAIEKLNELQHQRSDLKDTIANLKPTSSVQEEAEILIVSGRRGTVTDRREQHQKLARELQVIEAAIELQVRIVERQRAARNAQLRITNQPRHAELLKAFQAKLLVVEQAACDLERFYRENDNLVPRTMRFRGLGSYDPQTGRFENVARWEAEGHEFHCFDTDAAE